MSLSCWSGIAALALLPIAAIAQQGKTAGPADPDAPVPAASHASAFENYRAAPDAPSTPDLTWRAANAAVAGNDAHAGHVPMPMPKSPAHVEAAPGPAVPVPANPHAGHGGHHH